MSVLSKEKRDEFNRAMEIAEGNKALAAKILGMDMQAFKNRLYGCPDLRLRWTNPDRNETTPVLSEEQALTREPLITKEEVAALSIAEEDKKLKDGLASMGLSNKVCDLALALQKFHGANFTKSIEIASASVTRTGLNMLEQIEYVEERLLFLRKHLLSMGAVRDDKRDSWVTEENMVAHQYKDLLEQNRFIMLVNYEAAKITALIRFQGNKHGNSKIGKPKFTTNVVEMPSVDAAEEAAPPSPHAS